jgi:5-methylcytosine-specific restriction endonuclease McrA
MREEEFRNVFARTHGHCHFCGDPIVFVKRGWSAELNGHWEVDHVVQRDKGGAKNSENCLPACTRCKRLRWHRTGPNVREVLFLGILARKEVRKGSDLGQKLMALSKKRLLDNEVRRAKRQERGV